MVAGRRAALEARRRAAEMAAAVGSDIGPCLTFTEESCDHLALSEGEDTRHPSPIMLYCAHLCHALPCTLTLSFPSHTFIMLLSHTSVMLYLTHFRHASPRTLLSCYPSQTSVILPGAHFHHASLSHPNLSSPIPFGFTHHTYSIRHFCFLSHSPSTLTHTHTL